MEACDNGDLNKVKVLLASGAEIDTRNNCGLSGAYFGIGLFYSCKPCHREVHLAKIRMLILAGAHVSPVTKGEPIGFDFRNRDFASAFLQATADKVVYELRRAVIIFLLTDNALFSSVLVDLVEEYEVEQEYTFLLERARNMQKRVGKKRKNMD